MKNTKIGKGFVSGLWAIVFIALLAGCSTAPKQEGTVVPAKRPASKYVDPNVTYIVQETYDPWEGFNRSMYKFNYHFDRLLFMPAVNAYRFVTPDVLQTGVHNFFMNVTEITSFINSILQAKPKSAGITLSRFTINTTIGILGLFDHATTMGLEPRREDFGQTLGHWGVGAGPYVVLPILGPSNLRDTVGLTLDNYVLYETIDPFNFDDHPDRELIYYLMRAIDIRSNVHFSYYETGSPFEYEYVRFMYSEKRKFDIEK